MAGQRIYDLPEPRENLLGKVTILNRTIAVIGAFLTGAVLALVIALLWL